MNERLERLAFKVMDEPVDLERTHLKIDVVRFAELIVKETLLLARVGMEFGPSMDEAVYTYFGVEE
jgi:hypothetical protein